MPFLNFLYQQFDPRNTLNILRVAAADVEHESKAKAKDFLEGELSVEEFLHEYTDLRKVSPLS